MSEHLLTIAPLLVMVLIGFIAQRSYQVQSRSLAVLAIYILSPAVVLLGILGQHLSLSVLLLPVVVLLCGVVVSAVSYFIAGFMWKDARHQMVGYSSGTGNTSYFGIPVCGAILGMEAIPIAVLFALGQTLFESTMGYYLAARGEGSVKQSLIKLVTLPVLYALILALVLRSQNWQLPAVLYESLILLESAFTPIGMMLVGVGLGEAKLLSRPDFRFMGAVLCSKFLLLPGLMIGFILFDKAVLHLFDPLVHQVMLLQAASPIAVSTVAYAAQFKLFPEKMAMAVVVSVLLAVPIISALVPFLGSL